MKQDSEYVRGLLDAQKIADRIAGNDRDFAQRTREGAGMVSAELRTLINRERENHEPTTAVTASA